MSRYFIFSFLLFVFPVFASEDPACLTMAAKEFGVDQSVFSAMYRAEEKGVSIVRNYNWFGPMKLAEPAIIVASKHIQASSSQIKTDPCQNFRAAAWWLMGPSGGATDKDIWNAVDKYYYGNNSRVAPSRRFFLLSVKNIYSMNSTSVQFD